MTEEENKAIENFEKRLIIEKYTKNIGTPIYIKDIETILNLIQKLQEENNNKDKIIDLIQKEISEHIGFENRLKRDNREPDMFNQGRSYVANNIRHILKQAKEV